ncbi:hypothetical protein NEF87_000577 [Candidatus Lokiarchaeum ossiferum]|uniref:DUF998 domain-containing protein n=1 Tax=Candidatus Lokiarchaeum ossiferum TaxID=2951803 RepID=A0ABY6HN40_9ARCH|nr:hypothetical protein NEF87_000577 [Candidatus Lokiarchaeum sp. B-35]
MLIPKWLRIFDILSGILYVIVACLSIINLDHKQIARVYLLAINLLLLGFVKIISGLNYNKISKKMLVLNAFMGISIIVFAIYIILIPDMIFESLVLLILIAIMGQGIYRTLFAIFNKKLSIWATFVNLSIGILMIAISTIVYQTTNLSIEILIVLLSISFIINAIGRILSGISGYYNSSKILTRSQPTRKNYRLFLWIMTSVMLLSIVFAIIFYPEQYLWNEEYISNLGRISSRSGLENTTSRLIFTVGFLYVSASMFFLSIFILFDKKLNKLDVSKSIFLFLSGVGSLGTAVPTGLPETSSIHIWGTALFIFSFIVFLILSHFVKYKKTKLNKRKKTDDIFDKSFSFVVVICTTLYLLTFLFKIEQYVYLAQKIVFLLLIILVLLLDKEDFSESFK